MRLQLGIVAAAVLVASAAGPAGADGTLAMRGVYYKERATRVMQPMLDGMFEAGERGMITAHLLVDSITSASASAGAATPDGFTETRYEGGAGYAHELRDVRVGANFRYSTEPDYQSLYVGVRAAAELLQKNLTLSGGLGLGKDTVGVSTQGGLDNRMLQCEVGVRVESPECPLDTYSLFLSASQILSRRALIGVSYDVAALRGYTSNPYRSAIVGDTFLPEQHPNERLRQAYAISLRYHLAETATTFVGLYRYYRDDWRLRAHTPELRIIQEVSDLAEAAVRYRYHRQNKAFFFEDRYPMIPADGYVSDDPKLSAFDGHTLEAKLGVLGAAFELDGRWAAARFEGILQYVVQNNRFGNAIVAHIALTLPFNY